MFRYTIAILLSFYFCSVAVRAEMREFELPDGRTLEADIVDYNPSQGEVTLKRADGKKIPIKPGIFVEKDQVYIREWIAGQDFLSDKILSIKIEKNRIDSSTSGSSMRSKNELFVYDITVANRGRKTIGCRAEYRIYCLQWSVDPDRVNNRLYMRTKGALPGAFERIDIEAGTERNLQTESITISQVEREYPGKMEDELYGIWLRFYYMQSNGTELVRDLCLPENISSKHAWDEKSVSW